MKNPQFITTAVHPSGYPRIVDESGTTLPEVAVVGRSNVGKSTLLNHLFGYKNKKLVKTSSVPGKTQTINFFRMDELAFADLPGYGFAKVPKKVRQSWGPMIETYLKNREPLVLLLFLFDIRRVPTEEDQLLLDWIIQEEKAMILVLTKVDKVTKNEREKNTKKILDAFHAENIFYTYYSAPKNIGRQELIRSMQEAITGELEE